jgi:hypothetical protein
MGDEEQFYSDDTAQGQEGGFGGYMDESVGATPSFGQETDYSFFPQNNFGQETDYSFFPQNNFGQSDFNLGNIDYSNLDGLDSLFKMNQGQNGMTDFSFPGYANYQGMSLPEGQTQSTSWGDTLTNMLGGLSGLFGQNKNQQRGGQLSSGLGSIISALLTGKQNTKNAQQAKNIINQQQAATDPFASQRPFYQQQLQQAITNPYSVPIVADQVNALKRAQDIKNAAAGRRSNSATTDPELLKAMAEVAQKYQSSLQQPAGANFRRDMTGYKELLGANQQQTNGYISPLLSALGFTQQQGNNSANMESTLGNLVKVLQTMQQGQGQE